MKSVFIGSGVALVTPFRKDGSINEEMLEELVEYHCENQTDALIICGTTGESATLSEEERLFCIREQTVRRLQCNYQRKRKTAVRTAYLL